MLRRSFDKAFKTAAVKLIIKGGFSVKEVSYQLDIQPIVCIVGYKNTKNMEKVRFLAKEARFLMHNMK